MDETISMNERRRNARYQTIAKAKISGAGGSETLLKDISITGCCVECTCFIDTKNGSRYGLEIIPENAAGIAAFKLTVKPMWVRARDYSWETGFSIVESPKGKQFQRYVDYLSWRYSQGNSMTGSGTTTDTLTT